VQEFFDNAKDDYFPDIDFRLTTLSLQYLSSRNYPSKYASRLSSSHSLVSYCYENWHKHAKECQLKAQEIILYSFREERMISIAIQYLWYEQNRMQFENFVEGGQTVLHLFAICGFDELICSYLNTASSENFGDICASFSLGGTIMPLV
jgi:hypothetical protein